MKILILMLVLSFPILAQEEETEALRAMKLSCVKQKVGLGCYNYANMLARINKQDEADKFYELGCKYEHQPSCSKEKWDIPERKEAPEIVELPADAESPDTEPGETAATEEADEPMRPIYLPSRVSVRGGGSSSEATGTDNSGMPPEMNMTPSAPQTQPTSVPSKTPASEAAVESQNNESSGPAEGLDPSTPTDGSVPPPSLSM